MVKLFVHLPPFAELSQPTIVNHILYNFPSTKSCPYPPGTSIAVSSSMRIVPEEMRKEPSWLEALVKNRTKLPFSKSFS